MHSDNSHTFLFRLRSAVLGIAAAGLFYACLPSSAAAFPSRDKRVERYQEIDPAEGAKAIASFRALRLQGDFCFKFQLVHKPRKERTVRYQGMMYGTWNERGPVSRFMLYADRIGKDATVGRGAIELIVQNGVDPEVWIRRDSSQSFTLIEDDALFDPVFDGVLYTPFDLQMPFVYSNDYVYEGPALSRSRVGQRFLMQSPVGSLAAQHGISAVRIFLDDTYYALLEFQVLGVDGAPRSNFKGGSLKKVQGQYIVNHLELKDLRSKDATDFIITEASVGLLLNPSVFDPDNLLPVPEISQAMFDIL